MICKNCGATIADGSAFCTQCGAGFTNVPPMGAQNGDTPAPGQAYAPQQQMPYGAPMYTTPYYAAQPPKPRKSFVEIFWENVGCKIAAVTGFLASAFALFIGAIMSFFTFGYPGSAEAILIILGGIFGFFGSYLTLTKAKVGAIVQLHGFLFLFLHTVIYLWDTASIFASVLMLAAGTYGLVVSLIPNCPLAQRAPKN